MVFLGADLADLPFAVLLVILVFALHSHGGDDVGSRVGQGLSHLPVDRCDRRPGTELVILWISTMQNSASDLY